MTHDDLTQLKKNQHQIVKGFASILIKCKILWEVFALLLFYEVTNDEYHKYQSL